MRRTFAIWAGVLALLALPTTTARAVPPDFIGISPQGAIGAGDYELMEEAGLRSIRLSLFWSQVEPVSPFLRRPNWAGFDRDVELAARHGMEILPYVVAAPPWVGPEPRLEPVVNAAQRNAWASFLRRAVGRYGPGGTFWSEHQEVPYLPIRRWEIWNEPNIVTFGGAHPERFAALLRVSGRAVQATDPGAEVILGGLFGRPLQIPPNVGSSDFLARVYRARRVKQFFDGVALHPYVADAFAMRAQIRNLRRVMRLHGDARTPLYVTELGWGSAEFESRWERGPEGQARELDEALGLLAGHRREWRIGGVWWFSWHDQSGSCQFCDSAGLLTEQREAKPAWYRFLAWTGGDPGIVPRAEFSGGLPD